MIDQNDLAARPQHARAFRQNALRIGDQRDDELGNHAIERGILERELVRIHHPAHP